MSSDGLKLITLCSYLTETSQQWRQADWDASWMVKALKGDPINAYFDVLIAGKLTRFDQSNVADFVARIPRALAKMIKLHVEGPATLVPIPNSHVTGIATPDFKTLELAKLIASASGGQFNVVPALVFKKPQIKSRKGGPRSADHCEDAYRLASDVKGKIVLIDDVCTSGGHIIGAYRKLHAPPKRDIVLACTFGRSTKQQVNTPIGPREEVLDVSRGEF
jgi:adenine/guanine phosphoribosyltransferase-like PRPP-binding protein